MLGSMPKRKEEIGQGKLETEGRSNAITIPIKSSPPPSSGGLDLAMMMKMPKPKIDAKSIITPQHMKATEA